MLYSAAAAAAEDAILPHRLKCSTGGKTGHTAAQLAERIGAGWMLIDPLRHIFICTGGKAGTIASLSSTSVSLGLPLPLLLLLLLLLLINLPVNYLDCGTAT